MEPRNDQRAGAIGDGPALACLYGGPNVHNPDPAAAGQH